MSFAILKNNKKTKPVGGWGGGSVRKRQMDRYTETARQIDRDTRRKRGRGWMERGGGSQGGLNLELIMM